MKIPRGLKITLYALSLALYVSGTAAWILSRWFQIDEGFGLQPRPLAALALHSHGIISLFFLVLFGVLYESHITRGWRARRKLKSGLSLVSPLILVLLTVPGLYYLGDGRMKVTVTQIHTFVGLFLVVPLFIHIFTKVRERSVIAPKDARLEHRASQMRLRRSWRGRGGLRGPGPRREG